MHKIATRFSSTVKTGVVAAGLAMAVSLVGPAQPALAEGGKTAAMSINVAKWLNPDKRRVSKDDLRETKRAAHALNKMHGNGSYICGASGFGQKARCFAR